MAQVTLASAERKVRVTCLASDAVGHCVYVTGPSSGDVLQVARADVSLSAKMPAIGILVSKDTTTSGIVQIEGPYVPGFALPPNGRLWVGSAGTLVTVRPTAPAMLQIMGQAHDAATVWLRPSREMTKVI